MPIQLSPCIKICVLDPLSGICIGCGRTAGEIGLWPEWSDDLRRAVITQLPSRMALARSRGVRAGRVRRREAT